MKQSSRKTIQLLLMKNKKKTLPRTERIIVERATQIQDELSMAQWERMHKDPHLANAVGKKIGIPPSLMKKLAAYFARQRKSMLRAKTVLLDKPTLLKVPEKNRHSYQQAVLSWFKAAEDRNIIGNPRAKSAIEIIIKNIRIAHPLIPKLQIEEILYGAHSYLPLFETTQKVRKS